jgi:hypothetical protein
LPRLTVDSEDGLGDLELLRNALLGGEMLGRDATAAAVAAETPLLVPLGEAAWDSTAVRPGEGDLDLGFDFPALVPTPALTPA